MNELFEIEFDKLSDETIDELKRFIVEKFPEIIENKCKNEKILVQDRTREYYFCDILHYDNDNDTSEFGSYINVIPKNIKYYQVYKTDKENEEELIPIFIVKLFENGEIILNPEFDPLFTQYSDQSNVILQLFKL